MELIRRIVLLLDKVGVWDYLLPFVLVMVITWGVLERTKIFHARSDLQRKRINAIVSICIALFAVASVHIVSSVKSIAALSGFALIVFVIILMITRFLGGEPNKKTWFVIALITMAIIAIGVLGIKLPNTTFMNALVPMLIVLAIFGIMLWLLLRPEEGEKPKQTEKPKEEKKETQKTTKKPAIRQPTAEEIEEFGEYLQDKGITPEQFQELDPLQQQMAFNRFMKEKEE